MGLVTFQCGAADDLTPFGAGWIRMERASVRPDRCRTRDSPWSDPDQPSSSVQVQSVLVDEAAQLVGQELAHLPPQDWPAGRSDPAPRDDVDDLPRGYTGLGLEEVTHPPIRLPGVVTVQVQRGGGDGAQETGVGASRGGTGPGGTLATRRVV